MKYLANFLLVFLTLPALAAPSGAWLNQVPSSLGTWRDWTEIPAGYFFEVPASKLGAAEFELADVAFLPQEKSGVSYFDRADFECPASTKPYLVRAAYINGGTGNFSLYWAGSALVVSHASLGPGGTPNRSALVACLLQAPTTVFSALSGAL